MATRPCWRGLGTVPDSALKLRPEYANDHAALTAASQVIAMNFQTVAAANNYWRK